MYFIVINGAPGVGKDTLGQFLIQRLEFAGYNVIWGRIKDVMYKATAKRYNLADLDKWIEVCNDPILKERPMSLLGGKTPRDVLKYESEEVIKVLKGENGVVEEYIADLYETHGEAKLRKSIIVFTDGGFQSETDWLTYRGLPFSKPIIVRLCRKGCNFNNDTREYLRAPKYIFMNRYKKYDLDLMASHIVEDIERKGEKMAKTFIAPPIKLKHRVRAAMASAIMLKEGSIKFYELGLAYRCNLRHETKRKW